LVQGVLCRPTGVADCEADLKVSHSGGLVKRNPMQRSSNQKMIFPQIPLVTVRPWGTAQIYSNAPLQSRNPTPANPWSIAKRDARLDDTRGEKRSAVGLIIRRSLYHPRAASERSSSWHTSRNQVLLRESTYSLFMVKIARPGNVTQRSKKRWIAEATWCRVIDGLLGPVLEL